MYHILTQPALLCKNVRMRRTVLLPMCPTDDSMARGARGDIPGSSLGQVGPHTALRNPERNMSLDVCARLALLASINMLCNMIVQKARSPFRKPANPWPPPAAARPGLMAPLGRSRWPRSGSWTRRFTPPNIEARPSASGARRWSYTRGSEVGGRCRPSLNHNHNYNHGPASLGTEPFLVITS